jgi:hypothetical protein
MSIIAKPAVELGPCSNDYRQELLASLREVMYLFSTNFSKE